MTREEYAQLGYGIIPSGAFLRFEQMAEASVRRYTQDRIRDCDLRPGEDAGDEARRVAMMNQRGVCEMMDLYYIASNPHLRQVVTGFRNDTYSETYASGSGGAERLGVADVMRLYFTPAQLWRGVR